MSILVNEKTRLLVKGIPCAKARSTPLNRCIEYCTNVVGGVTPGKGGT